MDFIKLLDEIANDAALFTDAGSPFAFHVTEGARDSRVVVLVGENCSGKSVLFQVMAGWARRHHGAAPLTVSIRERTGGGTFEMGGLRRAMMFGDEGEQSTGATSVRVIQGAFSSATGWAEKDGKSPIIMLDEPDIGLAEGYAHAMGRWLAGLVEAAPRVSGLVVVTHSRALVRGLDQAARERSLGSPHFVNMGPRATDIRTWVENVPEHSVEELLAMKELGSRNRRLVADILTHHEKARQARPK